MTLFRKLGLILLSILLLAGCSAQTDVDVIIQESLSRPLPAGSNQSKSYVKYYLSPEFGVKASTPISTLIRMEDTEVMMNLKVSEIVASRYYNKERIVNRVSDETEGTLRKEGTYLDTHDEQRTFTLTIIELEHSKALVLENGLVDLVGIVGDHNIEYVLDSMLTIMRSVEVNEDLIVANYSNKEIIEYNPIHEGFFEQTVPEAGSLIDMYNHLNPDDKID